MTRRTSRKNYYESDWQDANAPRKIGSAKRENGTAKRSQAQGGNGRWKEGKERKNGSKEVRREGSKEGYILPAFHPSILPSFQPSNLPIFQPSSLFTFHVSRFTFHVSGLFLIFVYLYAGAAYSQDINVSAEVSPKTIRLGESATLRVTISGSTQLRDIQPPKLEPLQEFRVSYAGSSSQYHLIGTQISVSIRWSYILIAQKVGQFTLPKIRVPYGSQTYETALMLIEVVPKSQMLTPPPAGGRGGTQNFFTDVFNGGTQKIEAFVDNPRPYVNEQITYTFRYLYTARIPSLEPPKYTPPSLTHFWKKELPRKRRHPEVIDGTTYQVEEIKVALFPLTAGATTIEPAQLALPALASYRRSDTPKVLVTDAIEIQVRPLPQTGKPVHFTGAVGQYQIDAQVEDSRFTGVERGTIEAGNGFTLRLQVSGRGNIEMLTEPVISPLPNMTIYSPKITDAMDEAESNIQGNRTYEYVIIPSKAGNWTIPAIEYPYFDPQKESYQIAHTVPIPINVLPGGTTGTTTVRSTQSDIRVLKQDIQYIKPATVKLTDGGVYFYQRPSFWGMQLLPVVVLGVAYVYKRQRAKRNLTQLRGQNATRNALIAIEHAERKIKSGSAAFFSALANGLYQYIGDIFTISPTGLNPELVRQQCKETGISESSTTQFVDVLIQCDYARFAPASMNPTDMESALNCAKAAIHEIEKERRQDDEIRRE